MTRSQNINRGAKRQDEASYGDVHAKFEGQRQGLQVKHLTKQFNGPRQVYKGQANGQLTCKRASQWAAYLHKGKPMGSLPAQGQANGQLTCTRASQWAAYLQKGKPMGSLPARAHTG